MITIATYASAISIVIGSVVHNDRNAMICTIAVNALLYLFGGYIATNFDKIYVWIVWVQYFSPNRRDITKE